MARGAPRSAMRTGIACTRLAYPQSGAWAGSISIMPLNLHADCKARLLSVVAETLPEILVNNGMFINRMSGARLVLGEMVLPKTGKQRDRMVDYIDEFPLSKFILETLGIELWVLDKYVTDPPTTNLSAIEGYEDASRVAARLIEAFQATPCIW